MSFLDILTALAKGAGYTVLVTLACIATGLLVGLLVAVARRLQARGVQNFLTAFLYVFRGVPVLVLLFIVYFGLPSIGLNVPPLLAMMLSLGLVSGAYLSEVFRGALNAVDEHELLAAQAIGMSRMQMLVSIEIPQMLRFAVPGMLNEFTTVLKYTPFAYTVGIPEIIKEAMALASTTMRGVEIYMAVGLIYFAIYRLLLVVMSAIEKHFRVPGFAHEQGN